MPIPVDVRIVSATHRSLRKAVDAGEFRADLMYRLRVIPVWFIWPVIRLASKANASTSRRVSISSLSRRT